MSHEHEEGSGDGENISKANVQALMQYMEKHQQHLEEQKKMFPEQQQRIEAQQEMIERHHELTARVSVMMEILKIWGSSIDAKPGGSAGREKVL